MKVFFFVIILIYTADFSSFSQELIRKGAHQQQLETFGTVQQTAAYRGGDTALILPLSSQESNTLSNIVFGFLPYWEYNNGAHNNMHYDLLSHVAIFNFQASGNGSISNPSGWPWTEVINAAHAQATKVVMVVTNFNASEVHTLLTDTTAKNNLFNAIATQISTYQLDGVNIDFEGINATDRGSVLNAFLQDLSDFIHANFPGKEVSFDGPAVNWSAWQLNGLVQSVDLLFIMAYDYNGSWSSNTGACAPLIHPSGGICVSKSLDDDYAEAISNYPEKIVLGVPYYGNHWTTTTENAGSPVNAYMGATLYRNTVANATYGNALWDDNSLTSWYRWQDSDWHQIWADTMQSIELKYDKAIEKNLGGVGIWALNYDGNRAELWDLINSKFNNSMGNDAYHFNKNIVLYPNPTQSDLFIKTTSGSEVVSYEIFNFLGEKIKSGNLSNKRIITHSLQKGIYIIQLWDSHQNKKSFTVIKN